MIFEIYSIYDKKLGEFLPPFCCKNEADAVRMCSNLVNHSDSLMLKFPEDYVCHCIGTFDSQTSDLTSVDEYSSLKSVSIEFKTLVKDETLKYKEAFNSIQVEKGRLDCLADKLHSNIVTVEQLILNYKKKLDDIEALNTDHLDDGLSTHISKHELEETESNSKSVDTPDFLPTNNIPKSKKSFLDKLFS